MVWMAWGFSLSRSLSLSLPWVGLPSFCARQISKLQILRHPVQRPSLKRGQLLVCCLLCFSCFCYVLAWFLKGAPKARVMKHDKHGLEDTFLLGKTCASWREGTGIEALPSHVFPLVHPGPSPPAGTLAGFARGSLDPGGSAKEGPLGRQAFTRVGFLLLKFQFSFLQFGFHPGGNWAEAFGVLFVLEVRPET